MIKQIFLQYLQNDQRSEKLRNMSENALEFFDQSNLYNCNYIMNYWISNNIFLLTSATF